MLPVQHPMFGHASHVLYSTSADMSAVVPPAADVEPRCGTVRPSMETNVLIAKTQLGKVRTPDPHSRCMLLNTLPCKPQLSKHEAQVGLAASSVQYSEHASIGFQHTSSTAHCPAICQ